MHLNTLNISKDSNESFLDVTVQSVSGETSGDDDAKMPSDQC